MAMTIRLPADLHDRVARVAKEQGISINALVALAVPPYLEKHAQQKRAMTGWQKRTALEEHLWRKSISDRHAIRDES